MEQFIEGGAIVVLFFVYGGFWPFVCMCFLLSGLVCLNDA